MALKCNAVQIEILATYSSEFKAVLCVFSELSNHILLLILKFLVSVT